MANVAAAILMYGTAGPTAYAVNVLVALATVLGKVDAGAEHTANVRVPLVEALLHDGVDEGTTVEEHAFV